MAFFRIDDRWLWLGFGIISIFAVRGISLAMHDLVTITKLDPDSFEPDNETNKAPRPEDGISVEDLRTLAASTDPNIANSAISLLVSRIKRSRSEMASIRKDLRSKDQRTRRMATTAFDFLRQWPDPEDVEADSLRLPRPSMGRRRSEGLEPVLPPLPLAPRASQLSDNILGAPSALDEDALRQQRETLIADLGFNPWAIPEEQEPIVPSIENPVAGWTNVPRPRTSTVDSNDAEARRRRREAMVLHEGAGQVQQRDIIRPVNDITDPLTGLIAGEEMPSESEG